MGKKRKKKRMVIEGIECLHGKRGDDGNIRLTLIEYDEHTCICEVCGKHISKAIILDYAYCLNNIIPL